MSKYIIELGEDANMVQVISVTQSGNAYIDSTVYVGYLEQLNSDYINEHFGDLQEGKKATWGLVSDASSAEYQKGLNEAWEVAKKLFSTMAESDIERAFPTEWNNGGFNALINLQPQEAIEKLKAYEEKQKAEDEIKVGDEVIYNNTMKCLVVRPETDERYASLIDSNGSHHSAEHSECKKTGRHFDIQSILEDMKHD